MKPVSFILMLSGACMLAAGVWGFSIMDSIFPYLFVNAGLVFLIAAYILHAKSQKNKESKKWGFVFTAVLVAVFILLWLEALRIIFFNTPQMIGFIALLAVAVQQYLENKN